MQSQRNYADDLKKNQILATGKRRLLFLLTPEGENYLESFQVKEIELESDNDKAVIRDSFNLTEVNVSLRGDDGQPIKMSLFDLMFDMKHYLNCKFEFKINDDSRNILLVSQLPSGFIVSVFVIFKADNGDYFS